jgi:hypothetical protein
MEDNDMLRSSFLDQISRKETKDLDVWLGIQPGRAEFAVLTVRSPRSPIILWCGVRGSGRCLVLLWHGKG